MTNLFLIGLCLLVGFLLRRFSKTPKGLAHGLNFFVIYLSFPGLVFAQLPDLLNRITFGRDFFLAASMAWIHFVIAFALVWITARLFRWNRKVTGALILTVGLGNTSFVGFPLLDALLGPQAIPIGIIVDQPGTFLVLSTLGLVVASLYSGRNLTASALLKRIAIFPPFVSLAISILVCFLAPRVAEFLVIPGAKLSATLVPLALVSVGLQLSFETRALISRLAPLTVGLFFKLALIPALFFAVYKGFFHFNSFETRVVLLESAMAPMITAAVVASEMDLDSELANLMVGFGIPISLVTVWFWYLLL